MYASFIICLLVSETIAQFNGDFWWLNPKLNKYREQPSQPKFEYLSEFDTDESAKIIFRDEDLFTDDERFKDFDINETGNEVKTEKPKINIQFQDKSEIVWPDDNKQELQKPENTTKYAQDIQEGQSNKALNNDVLEFKFPEEDFLWQDKRGNETIKNNSAAMNGSNITNYDSGKITFMDSRMPIKIYKDVTETEHICTYMKKTECNRLSGISYIKYERGPKRPLVDSRLICCILPTYPEHKLSKIYFLDDSSPSRFKRSNKEDKVNPALKQRNNLLLLKFGSQLQKGKFTTPNPTKHKIVTPSSDDYVDPYWNIKSSNFKNKNKQGDIFHQTNTKYDYDSDDYIEDYVVELPSPGLVGLYSDHGPSKPSWTFPGAYGGEDSVEEEDQPTFGYGPTVDPRLGDRSGTTKSRINGRPVKLTTSSNERRYDAESQTISYQSNPDFKVLQGFKLLNLVRNKSRVFRNGKKTTTERIYDDDSKEHVLTGSSFESDYDGDTFDKTYKSHKECGKIVKNSNWEYENEDKQIGDAPKGSHPWLALVVLTKKRQNILCYATIIHPKAAVTTGDCVYGRTSAGETTLIAGAWRLNEESREDWQTRMVSVQLHSQYKPGELALNLAILHWKRPLRFNADVQPACLAEPHVGDDCKFSGWGGFDQAIRKQPRWQRTSIMTSRACSERLSRRLPSEAFCTSVQSRGTVTGIGGPLICKVDGRFAVTGVAVWREHAVVLIPAQEWTKRQLAQLELL